MVDPRNGARAVIRDTGLDGGRYLWSVLAAGEMDPVSDGRTDVLARARSIAETPSAPMPRTGSRRYEVPILTTQPRGWSSLMLGPEVRIPLPPAASLLRT